MRLQILNYGCLELPEDGIELGGKRTVDHCKKFSDLSNNCAALEYLLHRVPYGTPVKDFFAGVGMWATVARGVLRPRDMILCDYDLGCANYLADTFTDCKVFHQDSYKAIERGQLLENGVNLFDFTKCTWLTLQKEKWGEALLNAKAAWVVISDCAGAKIHLNYRSYNLKQPSYREYLERYEKWIEDTSDFSVGGVAVCGRGVRPRSSYLLLKRNGISNRNGAPQVIWNPTGVRPVSAPQSVS